MKPSNDFQVVPRGPNLKNISIAIIYFIIDLLKNINLSRGTPMKYLSNMFKWNTLNGPQIKFICALYLHESAINSYKLVVNL